MFRKKRKIQRERLSPTLHSLIKDEYKHHPEPEPEFGSEERDDDDDDDDDGEEEFVVVQVGWSDDEIDPEEGPSIVGKGKGKRKASSSSPVSKSKAKPSKTAAAKRKKPRKSSLVKRKNMSAASSLVPLSEFETPRWANMAPGKKAAALKTYVKVYGKHSLGCKLRCITEPVQDAVVNLETDLISAHGNATFLELGFKEDPILRTCNKRYHTAFHSLLKTLDKLRDKVMTDLIQFIQHDVALFCTLEDELDGFVREVGNQSEDVVRANPPPQPERMINLSLFNRNPSAKGSGGRKKFGGNSTHVTGSSSSTRRTASGGISSTASSLGAGGSGQGRTASGNRGKKTTGLRPVMNEFVDYTSRLSS